MFTRTWPALLRPFAIVGLVAAYGLSACAQVALPTPAQPAVEVVVPAAASATTSFAGQLWLVKDAQQLIAGVPPLPEPLPTAPPPPLDIAEPKAEAAPASFWISRELANIAAFSATPPRAARGLMLLGVAMNDALTVGARARAGGMDVSDDALLAEAAARVLIANHPLSIDAARADAEQAQWAGVWRGEASVAGVWNGRQLGAAVSDAVLAWAAQDGSASLAANVALPAPGPGIWQPTAPQRDLPQEPEWAKVRTVAIGDPATMRVPAPPDWQSPEMNEQVRQLVAQRASSDEERARVRYWAAGMGTVTPPGMWAEIARDQIAANKPSLAEATGVYAALGVALHDAAIACWESKYHYWFARPITRMQADDAAWTSLIKTPPHPSYPSGHASFSGAASAVLSAAFPDAAKTLGAQAEAAAHSRVLAGIHWPIDSAAGLVQGRQVAERVLSRLKP